MVTIFQRNKLTGRILLMITSFSTGSNSKYQCVLQEGRLFFEVESNIKLYSYTRIVRFKSQYNGKTQTANSDIIERGEEPDSLG